MTNPRRPLLDSPALPSTHTDRMFAGACPFPFVKTNGCHSDRDLGSRTSMLWYPIYFLLQADPSNCSPQAHISTALASQQNLIDAPYRQQLRISLECRNRMTYPHLRSLSKSASPVTSVNGSKSTSNTKRIPQMYPRNLDLAQLIYRSRTHQIPVATSWRLFRTSSNRTSRGVAACLFLLLGKELLPERTGPRLPWLTGGSRPFNSLHRPIWERRVRPSIIQKNDPKSKARPLHILESRSQPKLLSPASPPRTTLILPTRPTPTSPSTSPESPSPSQRQPEHLPTILPHHPLDPTPPPSPRRTPRRSPLPPSEQTIAAGVAVRR